MRRALVLMWLGACGSASAPPPPGLGAPLDAHDQPTRAPSARERFLALDDDQLAGDVGFALAVGAKRELTQVERDVQASYLAFDAIDWDGAASLRHDDLGAIAGALRRIGLVDHARAIDRLVAGANTADVDGAWNAIATAPRPVVAAYIRAHADQIDWSKLTPPAR